jgi:hypothetical protein
VPLPNPYDYSDWQSFASALLSTLTGVADISGGGGVASGAYGPGIVGTIPPGSIPPPPGNALPVYWSLDNSELFLAPDFYVPPPVITPFQIDTQSLALASVELAQIADGAVGTNKIIDLAVINAKIANATILSAKIGDLQVVTAKIDNLAVNTAKIANLAVGTAQIADAAITTAKIGTAQIGTAQIANAAITNALIANASIGSAQIIDASIQTADIGLAQIGTALIQNAAITNALMANASIGSAQIINAAILTADIANAQITTALIANAAITTALIANAAITNALIANGTILDAKIANLSFDKMIAGTLNAVVDMGTGLIRFTIGGNTLVLGKGFGTTSQFIMWFGPSMAESLMSESNAIFYLKKTGDAYFGGTLAAGILRTTGQTSDQSATAQIVIGNFSSNGGSISTFLSYDWHHEYRCDHGTGSITGTGSATVLLEASSNGGTSWTTLATLHPSESPTVVVDSDPSIQDIVTYDLAGSTTVTWTPGALTTLQLRGRLTARATPSFGGTTQTGSLTTQNITVSSTEQ